MADPTKLISYANLSAYDTLIKAWSNSENQIAYKTVLKSADGNSLLFYKKPNAIEGTDTPDKTISLGNSDMQHQLNELADICGATWDSTNKEYTIALDQSFDANTDTIVAALNELKGQINILNGSDSTVGSVAKSIKDAVEGLDVTEFPLAEVNNNVVTIHGISEADGEIVVGADSANDIVLEEVAYTGAAADVSTAVITDGDATDPQTLYPAGTAQGTLEAIARDLNALESESVVTVEKQQTAETGYFATYVVKQNNVAVGEKINIPKDYLVKSATVETVITPNVPYQGAEVGDKYIDFTVNVYEGQGTESHIYIPVDDLMAAISGGTTTVANEYELQVSVDAHNVITAALNNIYAQKVQYVPTSATTVLTNVTTVKGAIDAIDTLIQGMDADLDASGTPAHSGVFVMNGVTEADGVITSVDSIEVEPAGAVAAAIDALDATPSQTAGTDGLALSLTEVNGVVTSISGSIAPGTYYDTTNYVLAEASDINALFE